MSRAATSPTTRELTLEDYLALPETMTRQEVVDGVITPLPAPTILHQRLLMRLSHRIDDFVSANDLGVVIIAPVDILIRTQPKLRVRQPDLIFAGRERIVGIDLDTTNILRVTPDLAVEISSPSDRPGRWAEKLADYAALGIPEVWRIDPAARMVEILALHGGAYLIAGVFGMGQTIASAVLPGLDLAVAAIFD
jgi:Uma2 family endonuclease